MKALILILALLIPSLSYAATLTWTDNANNELGIIVKRKLTQFQPGTSVPVNVGSFAELVRLSQVDQVTYVDQSAVADINFDNEYCYMVTAWNLSNTGVIQESPNSNQVCIVIPRPVPPVVIPTSPSGLVVTP